MENKIDLFCLESAVDHRPGRRLEWKCEVMDCEGMYSLAHLYRGSKPWVVQFVPGWEPSPRSMAFRSLEEMFGFLEHAYIAFGAYLASEFALDERAKYSYAHLPYAVYTPHMLRLKENIADFFKAFEQWYRDQLPGDVAIVTRYCGHLETYVFSPDLGIVYQALQAQERVCAYCEAHLKIRHVGQKILCISTPEGKPVSIKMEITGYKMRYPGKPEYQAKGLKGGTYYIYESEIAK